MMPVASGSDAAKTSQRTPGSSAGFAAWLSLGLERAASSCGLMSLAHLASVSRPRARDELQHMFLRPPRICLAVEQTWFRRCESTSK